MMTSFLNLAERAPQEEQTPGSEYELVLGRAQIASWLFVGVIAIAVCGSLAYLAGETVAAKRTVRAAAVAPVRLPVALPQASLLPTDVCASGEKCAPCYNPTAADPNLPTGACNLACDAPKRPPLVLSCPYTGAPIV